MPSEDRSMPENVGSIQIFQFAGCRRYGGFINIYTEKYLYEKVLFAFKFQLLRKQPC